MRCRCLVPVVMVAMVAPAVPSQGRSSSHSKRRRARKLFLQGKRSFSRGQYAEAIQSFKKAFEIRAHRVFQVNIAIAYLRLGKILDAYQHLQKYLLLRKPSDPPLPPALRSVLRQVGTLTVRVPNPNAQVFVDGRLVGSGEVVLHFTAGRHAVDVRFRHRVVASRMVEIKGGQEQLWELTPGALERARPRPRLRPRPRPPVRRRAQPRRPVPRLALPSTPTHRTHRLGHLHYGWFAAVASLTTGALAAAIALSYKNKQIHDQFAQDRSNTHLAHLGALYQDTAYAMWGTAGVLGASAAALAIFTRWHRQERPDAARMHVAPLLKPGAVGLTLTLTR